MRPQKYADETHSLLFDSAHASSVELTFSDPVIFNLSEQKLNCKEIIEGLAKVLKKHTGELAIY